MTLIWRCREHSQRLRWSDAVIRHLEKYRQSDAKATEAGGQLFGTVTSDEVRVLKATGPYTNDDRSRYRYRSDAKSAQRAIVAQAKGGLVYLGEWHTHAEDLPTPSGDDLAAMTTLCNASRLSTSSVLLAIVGRADPPHGIRICSFGQYGRIDWHCDEPFLVLQTFGTRIKMKLQIALSRVLPGRTA